MAKKLSDAQLKDLLARVKFFTRKTGAISFTVATKDDAGRTHVLRWAVVDPSFKFPRNIDWSTEQDFRTKPSPKASSKAKNTRSAQVDEVIRLSGKNINADGKPNASREELRFLGPQAVKFLMAKMGRGDVGVQIGKTGLKLTVMRDFGTVVPAVPGMKHGRTIVSGRGDKGRYTHTYTKPGVKFGSF